MYQEHYSHFLSARPNVIHFAAHSHHYWPDVSRYAHLQYWDDSARLADEKWGHIFSEIVPQAQHYIASELKLSNPKNICFAPNTHELLCRLLSCFPADKPLRILTTDSEFYSCARQLTRLEERSSVTITRIPTEPFATFTERFCELINGEFDFIYLSHVFFNSGFVVKDLPNIVERLSNPDTVLAIDGYHAFGAIPVDLSKIESRVFYLGGAYKYLQAGEGACFLCIPDKCSLRPENTGWFATFSSLEDAATGSSETTYSSDGFRFWGATFDPSGIYRFNAVQKWLGSIGLNGEAIHNYVLSLQQHFTDKMKATKHSQINSENLLLDHTSGCGHFFTFRFPEAQTLHNALREKDIVTDVRGDCLRVGFGLYQTTENIDEFFNRLTPI